MTVRELTEKADSREIAEWMWFLQEEQYEGPEWIRNAQLCATMVNVANALGQRRVPKKSKVQDFMPPRKKQAQSPDQMKAMLKSLTGGS